MSLEWARARARENEARQRKFLDSSEGLGGGPTVTIKVAADGCPVQRTQAPGGVAQRAPRAASWTRP